MNVYINRLWWLLVNTLANYTQASYEFTSILLTHKHPTNSQASNEFTSILRIYTIYMKHILLMCLNMLYSYYLYLPPMSILIWDTLTLFSSNGIQIYTYISDFGYEWGRHESYGRKARAVLHIISIRIQWNWFRTSKPTCLNQN